MDMSHIGPALHKHHHQLALFLSVLTLVCLALYLGYTSRYFRLSLPTLTESTSTEEQSIPLSNYHLMGYFADNYDDLPETQLQLTLQGTAVDPATPNLSIAIVSSPAEPVAKFYRIDDVLPGDALIKDIQGDRIIIDNNGELQKLTMPVPTLRQQPAVSVPTDSGLSPA